MRSLGRVIWIGMAFLPVILFGAVVLLGGAHLVGLW